LHRAGHWVTVYEKADRIGGLLRYGIPDFKLEKWIIDRRIDLMSAEGVTFETGCDIGDAVSFDALRGRCDTVVIAIGAGQARELPVPGRDLRGVHLAMEYLPQQNRRVSGEGIAAERAITAVDRRVIILGGGDTGADCLGNVHREACSSVHQFELLERPPDARADDNPWPVWPVIMRTSPAHEEGGTRDFGIQTTHFEGDAQGRLTALHAIRVEPREVNGRIEMVAVPGTEFSMPADLVLLAMGFVHPVRDGLLEQTGAELDSRGNLVADANMETTVPGVFAAGDAHRGASLIVWAIAEGRRAAAGCDAFLMANP